MQAKLAIFGLLVAAGGGGWYFAGPGGSEYYDLSPQEAASMLVTARNPATKNPGNGDFNWRVYKRGIDQVVWEVSLARAPVATFTANLEADGAGTLVSLDFQMADNEVANAAASDLGDSREFLTDMAQLVMEEHIDATLERRPFSEESYATEMAKYWAANPIAARDAVRQMKHMDDRGSSSATKEALRQHMIDDAAWHGEIDEATLEAYESRESGDSDFAEE